jgi:hypothetical protein
MKLNMNSWQIRNASWSGSSLFCPSMTSSGEKPRLARFDRMSFVTPHKGERQHDLGRTCDLGELGASAHGAFPVV